MSLNKQNGCALIHKGSRLFAHPTLFFSLFDLLGSARLALTSRLLFSSSSVHADEEKASTGDMTVPGGDTITSSSSSSTVKAAFTAAAVVVAVEEEVGSTAAPVGFLVAAAGAEAPPWFPLPPLKLRLTPLSSGPRVLLPLTSADDDKSRESG